MTVPTNNFLFIFIENMIQDDKDEILELLRSLKRDPVAKKMCVGDACSCLLSFPHDSFH